MAREWFRAKEGGLGGRNTLLQERLNRMVPGLEALAERLFRFEVVRGINR